MPWTIAAGDTGGRPGGAAASGGGGAIVAARAVAATGGSGAAGAWDSCPLPLPQHSLPIALQACRSMALIGHASEKQSGAPKRTAKAAARNTAATGRRGRMRLTREVYAQRGGAGVPPRRYRRRDSSRARARTSARQHLPLGLRTSQAQPPALTRAAMRSGMVVAPVAAISVSRSARRMRKQ